MKPIDRCLIAIGCGCAVSGWAMRRADIATIGLLLLLGYAVVSALHGRESGE